MAILKTTETDVKYHEPPSLAKMKSKLERLMRERDQLTGRKGQSSKSGIPQTDRQTKANSVAKLDLDGDGRVTPLEVITYSRRGTLNPSVEDSSGIAFLKDVIAGGKPRRKPG
jgi:hypothetical protein